MKWDAYAIERLRHYWSKAYSGREAAEALSKEFGEEIAENNVHRQLARFNIIRHRKEHREAQNARIVQEIDKRIQIIEDMSILDFSKKILDIDLYPLQAQILREAYEKYPNWSDLLLILGRKSFKTGLASIVVLYEVYKLLNLEGDIYQRWQLIKGEPIYFLIVATTKDQAESATLARIKAMVKDNWYFKDKVLDTTASEIIFKKNLIIKAQSSSSRASRGLTCKLFLPDELAWFMNTEGNFSGKEIFEALKPNVRPFGKDGKVIITTTPAGKQGIVWDLYNFSKQSNTILCYQKPTWEVNLGITFDSLKSEFDRDSLKASMEWGAEFADTVNQFLDPNKIQECINKSKELLNPGIPEKTIPRYIALDPGLKHDRFALVMCSQIGDKISVDYIHYWQGSREAPVLISDVEAHIEQLCANFNIQTIGLDQYQSASTIQRLGGKGLPVHETVFTQQYNMQLYSNLLEKINSGQIELPDYKLLIDELRFLRRKISGNKWSVSAPESGLITTDDFCDALANSAFLCSFASAAQAPPVEEGVFAYEPDNFDYKKGTERTSEEEEDEKPWSGVDRWV